LLLLHGWTATAALNWFTALPALGQHYRVVAMDIRGHGRGLRGRPFSLRGCANDAAALCTLLELPPVIAVGYSMGGPIAQLLWRRHPEQVAGLVLCATSTHFSRPRAFDPAFDLAGRGLALGLGFVPGGAQRQVARHALRGRFAATDLGAWAVEQRARNEFSSLVSAGVELRRYDSRSWIGEVNVPTAVVATTGDQLVPPRRQLAMAEAIPGARVFPVAADHAACAAAPRLFVPALVAACADVAARAAR